MKLNMKLLIMRYYVFTKKVAVLPLHAFMTATPYYYSNHPHLYKHQEPNDAVHTTLSPLATSMLAALFRDDAFQWFIVDPNTSSIVFERFFTAICSHQRFV